MGYPPKNLGRAAKTCNPYTAPAPMPSGRLPTGEGGVLPRGTVRQAPRRSAPGSAVVVRVVCGAGWPIPRLAARVLRQVRCSGHGRGYRIVELSRVLQILAIQ